MTTTIFVCDTCRYDEAEQNKGEKTGGELFAEQVERLGTEHPQLSIRRHPCLMGCSRHCTAALKAPGKMSYVLGGFRPDAAEDAAGLIDYALLHASSKSGVVPFKQWPQAIKGHFISRIPPLG